jgi:DNA polymerase III delta prime subunit
MPEVATLRGMKFFNTAGPCRQEDHYTLPAASRLPEMRELIDQKAYFVIHAPRQIGKTTMMMELARELSAEGRYLAVLLSLETGAAFKHDPERAQREILLDWRRQVRLRIPAELQIPPWPGDVQSVSEALWHLTANSSRPFVALLDEIDALEDESLVTVL